MIDIHCHILPGIDDGASDLDAALAMARIAAEDGITDTVATPHAFDGVYENTREKATRALGLLRERLERERIPLRVHLGSDCHLDERIFDPKRAEDVLTVAGGKYLLIEFPHELVPPHIEASLFRLRAKGLVPILTHPERNAELQRKDGVERIAAWAERGMLVQVTAESLTGAFGRPAKSVAADLIRRRLCHFVASDAHSPTWRRPVLSKARDEVERLAGRGTAEWLVEKNPSAALRNEPIEAAVEPEPEDAAAAAAAKFDRPAGRKRFFLFWK